MEHSMTTPASSDARDHVSKPTPKLPHERDESAESDNTSDRPEIQRAYDDVSKGQRDTSKAGETDATYNETVVPPGGRQSGTASGRTQADPASKK
jgi:hypothetical protein